MKITIQIDDQAASYEMPNLLLKAIRADNFLHEQLLAAALHAISRRLAVIVGVLPYDLPDFQQTFLKKETVSVTSSRDADEMLAKIPGQRFEKGYLRDSGLDYQSITLTAEELRDLKHCFTFGEWRVLSVEARRIGPPNSVAIYGPYIIFAKQP